MRVFSDFDKQFMKNILALEKDGHNILLLNLFLRGLLPNNVSVRIKGREPYYQLKEGEPYYHSIEILSSGSQDSVYFNVTGALYSANDLMNYLIENGYLLQREGSEVAGLYIQYKEYCEEEDVRSQILYINNTLLEFLQKLPYHYNPTEALRDLVKNNFRTKEERNNRTTRIISIVSASIAVLSILVNYFINKNKVNPPVTQTVIIDSNSIDYLVNKISKDNQAILNIASYLIKKTPKDTVIVKKDSIKK